MGLMVCGGAYVFGTYFPVEFTWWGLIRSRVAPLGQFEMALRWAKWSYALDFVCFRIFRLNIVGVGLRGTVWK